MKFNKCWLSTGALCALFLALCQAEAPSEAAGDSSVIANTQPPTIDDTLFKKVAESGTKYEFQAHVVRLLNIFAKNLYTNDEAFIRELISNSIDAIEKVHQAKLAQSKAGEELDDLSNYKIIVQADKDKGILTITDNGIGMTREELRDFLGTIAKSGTADFKLDGRNATTADDSSLIGQFGVGFYSVLLVADEVAVVSKNDKDADQWVWESDASASFRIAKDPRGNTLGRGTQVVLKLKKDAEKFLNLTELEAVMKNYFGHDRHNIYLVKPKTVDEEIEEEADERADTAEAKEEPKDDDGVQVEDENPKDKPAEKAKVVTKTIQEPVLISQSKKPIWKRRASEVTLEEYKAFYKTISKDYGAPLAHTHMEVEGANGESFRAILYIPQRPPYNPFSSTIVSPEVKLHVRGVFVTAKLEEFIPRYFGFIRGVIDSDDLPLNISRDIIQNNASLRSIRKKVINKIIEMISKLARDDPAKYKEFYSGYSNFLKLDMIEREDNRAILAKLLRFRSTKTEGEDMIGFEQYIGRASEKFKEKKVIYYLSGNAEEIRSSPFLARFREKDIEVLLMTDPVDDHTIQALNSFDGFKLENVAKDGLQLDEEDEKEVKEFDAKFKTAKEHILKVTAEHIEKVVFVPGPEHIPGSIKSSQWGWTGNTERIAMAQSSAKDDPMVNFFLRQKKILELNPKNPLVREILERITGGQADPGLRVIVSTLTESIMISSGYTVRDPAKFVSGVNRLISQQLGLPVHEDPLPEEPKKAGERDVAGEIGEDGGAEKLEAMLKEELAGEDRGAAKDEL